MSKTDFQSLLKIIRQTERPALFSAGRFLWTFFALAVFLPGGPVAADEGRNPVFEIYPGEDILPERVSSAGGTLWIPGEKKPKVAIIIDDIGYHVKLAERLLAMDAEITFSVFPFAPHREEIVRMIRERGREMMLHLPMEPNEYPSVSPGDGALMVDMTPPEMAAQLAENLKASPQIVGVNNHMGSRLTAMPVMMFRLFSALKKRELFFIDSFTSPDSACAVAARQMQIPFARRDVFLDHKVELKSIRRQIEKLVKIAEAYGEAVGIGHPHAATCRALEETMPELQKKVRLVPASRIVHTLG